MAPEIGDPRSSTFFICGTEILFRIVMVAISELVAWVTGTSSLLYPSGRSTVRTSSSLVGL